MNSISEANNATVHREIPTKLRWRSPQLGIIHLTSAVTRT